MKYKVEITTEQELDIPQFWASDSDVFFHKLLPNGSILEVRPYDFRPSIRLCSIEVAIHCGINEITEEQFNVQLELTKQYLGCY
jgi:hypothetical protein